MIVASIRKGFQQHNLKGLGCADCGGGCGKFTGGPIGPAASHIHALMGLGDCVASSYINTPGQSGYFSNIPTGQVIPATCQDYVNFLSPVLDASYLGANQDPNLQNTINAVQAAVAAVPVQSVATPMVSQVAQTVQQQVQANGTVAIPVVVPVASTAVGVSDNSFMNFLESTIFGIPLWLIGVGGLALGFMGSEK